MDVADMRKDAAEAFQNAQQYHQELQDIYRYYMPFRQSTAAQSREGGSAAEGAPRTSQLFDATGLSAAFNFAGNMQEDWTPLHQEFFALTPGPLVTDTDQRELLASAMQQASGVVHALMPRVQVQVHEMYQDLFAGTGALLMPPGNKRRPLRARAIPVNEIALDEGADGEVEEVWWRRNWKARDIEREWPDGTISDRLNQLIKDKPREPVEVTQYTYYDAKDERWRLCVWADAAADEAGAKIWEEDFATNQWITPRFFKVPGEKMGRGLAHLGLPFVKTANKARELALLGAAFAIMGIWMRRDDGVFNPETAIFEPMRMWTVQSTGGVLGPSISRLPAPQDLDLSSIIIGDEREQIKRVLLDDEMPDDQLAVRSATEIAGRLQRYARRRGGTGARLSIELVEPMVKRALDVLEEQGLLKVVLNGQSQETKLTIDNLLTQMMITAPAAAAQRADKVERAVRWIEMITMMLGPQAAMLTAKVEELLPEIGRWMGNEEKFIRSKGERKELTDLVAQIVAQQQQQQAQAAQQPPTPGEQQQELVNGGGV